MAECTYKLIGSAQITLVAMKGNSLKHSLDGKDLVLHKDEPNGGVDYFSLYVEKHSKIINKQTNKQEEHIQMKGNWTFMHGLHWDLLSYVSLGSLLFCNYISLPWP